MSTTDRLPVFRRDKKMYTQNTEGVVFESPSPVCCIHWARQNRPSPAPEAGARGAMKGRPLTESDELAPTAPRLMSCGEPLSSSALAL